MRGNISELSSKESLWNVINWLAQSFAFVWEITATITTVCRSTYSTVSNYTCIYVLFLAYGNMNICIEPWIPELHYEQAWICSHLHISRVSCQKGPICSCIVISMGGSYASGALSAFARVSRHKTSCYVLFCHPVSCLYLFLSNKHFQVSSFK